MPTEEQINKRDREYLDSPDPEVIWLAPKCDSVPSARGEGRVWCEDMPEDCPECGMKPVRYIRSDLVLHHIPFNKK